MKLYLSSYRIPEPESFFELFEDKYPDEINIGVITNAKDFRDDKAEKLQKLTDDLGKIGLTRLTYIDLLDHLEPKALYGELVRFDALMACGGQTNDLRWAMEQVQFGKILSALLRQGKTYIGESAGACVAGSTLKNFEDPDDPTSRPVVEDGLGLVSGAVVVHADDPSYQARTTELVKSLEISGVGCISLNNNQAYVVNGSQSKIVTGE